MAIKKGQLAAEKGNDMPKGTRVERCYKKLLKQGKSKASAARICQAATGLSLKTGKKPKRR